MRLRIFLLLYSCLPSVGPATKTLQAMMRDDVTKLACAKRCINAPSKT